MNSSHPQSLGVDFRSVDVIPEDPKVRLDYFRRFKSLLETEREKIFQWHRQGAGGREVVQAQTGLVDEAIKQVVHVLNQLPTHREKDLLGKFALIAVGGYGRGELNPCSDIDLLFLFSKKMDRALDNFIQDVISVLWGIGLEIGQSCRTLKDCKTLALEDSTVRTSMAEMRFLTGAQPLYLKLWDSMRKSVLKKKSREFLTAKSVELKNQQETLGGVTSQPEPDLKNGPGGLRDYHLALWAVAICFEGLSLREVQREDLATPQELTTLDTSVDFLLRVRNELHYLQNKKTDVLNREIQKPLARNLGYATSEMGVGVEGFMREYFMHASTIRRIAHGIFNRCLDAKPRLHKMIGTLKQRKLGDGFFVSQSRLKLDRALEAELGKDPEILVKLFRHVMVEDVSLDNRLQRLVRENLSVWNEEHIQSPSVRKFLRDVLDHTRSEKILRLMHELGVLGKILPEFGQTLFKVNYDFYHHYTSDEQSLRMIRFLEELETLEQEGLERLVSLYLQIPDRFVVKMACLFHDFGEGRLPSGDTKRDESLQSIADQFGLEESQRQRLSFLVANINTMNEIAFHQDIHQPSTIRQFAGDVESVDCLNSLLLVSYAELKAVAPGTWTSWKKTLLMELYHRTLNYMVRPESIDERPQATRAAVFSVLGQEVPKEVIADHLKGMTQDYFLTADSKNIVDHIRLIQKMGDRPFVLETQFHENDDFYDVMLCCHNDIDLFKNIVGTLTAKALNILGAQIFVREDNIAIILLQVAGTEVAQIHGDAQELWKQVETHLGNLLSKTITLNQLLRERTRLMSENKSKAALTPKIQMENYPDNPFTFVRIEARDHPGMLYKIVHTFAKFDIELHRAKIGNRGGRGIDVFSISLRQQKITFRPLLRRIKESIIYALLVEKLEDLA